MSNKGKKVKVHYTGTLDDGTKFDSSLDRGEPLEFTCMARQMIPGFDAAVELMEQGETKTVHIPLPTLWKRNEGWCGASPDQIPNGNELPVGQTVYMQSGDGQIFPVFVQSIEDGVATFDMNHELAGKDLNFEITLVEIEAGDIAFQVPQGRSFRQPFRCGTLCCLQPAHKSFHPVEKSPSQT